MTNYTYLGWGTTDSNGVAKLDHDANDDPLSHSYTGVGAGEIDVVASLDKPIASGSVQSEPYSICDAFIVDTGIYGTANAYGIDDAELGVQVLTDGTVLSNTGTTHLKRIMNNNSIGADANDITSAFTMEFDIVSVAGRVGFNFYQTSGTSITDYANYTMNITAPCHFKMVHDGTKFSIWIDDTIKANNVSHTWNSGRFVFMLYGNYNSSIKYKNFVVYPI